MDRGEDGVTEAGVDADMMFAAESGLLESLRRQASLQYRIELQGVVICFSHKAQYCKKQAAIVSSGWFVSKIILCLRGEPSKAPTEVLCMV